MFGVRVLHTLLPLMGLGHPDKRPRLSLMCISCRHDSPLLYNRHTPQQINRNLHAIAMIAATGQPAAAAACQQYSQDNKHCISSRSHSSV